MGLLYIFFLDCSAFVAEIITIEQCIIIIKRKNTTPSEQFQNLTEKNKKYPTVGTITKSNRKKQKIPHCRNNYKIQLKNKKYNIVGTVPKYHTVGTVPQSN